MLELGLTLMIPCVFAKNVRSPEHRRNQTRDKLFADNLWPFLCQHSTQNPFSLTYFWGHKRDATFADYWSFCFLLPPSTFQLSVTKGTFNCFLIQPEQKVASTPKSFSEIFYFSKINARHYNGKYLTSSMIACYDENFNWSRYHFFSACIALSTLGQIGT